MGWGSCEPPEPADEEIGAKPTLNAGSSQLHSVEEKLTDRSGRFVG